jgi:hypothetical protein
MGFRFSRRFRILPGLRLNASKSGLSASVGRKGAWLTFGSRRTRETVGIPGTGVSYPQTQRSGNPSIAVLTIIGALIVVALAIFG